MTASPPARRWAFLVVEAFLIVVSILLAFAIGLRAVRAELVDNLAHVGDPELRHALSRLPNFIERQQVMTPGIADRRFGNAVTGRLDRNIARPTGVDYN